jgi:hypothetical protein
VTVSVLDHPEFGQTLTRADGRFDLAVNGGGQLTVSYARDGYLPIQRRMEVPWQDYVALPDVVMIQPDPNVSAIDLSSSAPIQVASGSPITDSRGTRQARLFFQQGTMATMTLPNGATQQLSTMHVRATEYTVGASGQASMPGDLPAGEAYMYAADFTVDEATAAKATSVQFSKPVISYTENFLNLAVGSKVPSLYRDPANGTWVNGPSVLVIKILSVSNGLADLDVDGSGQPASAATLAGLGITDPERQQLAATYAPGQTLWRGALTHFTDWDY